MIEAWDADVLVLTEVDEALLGRLNLHVARGGDDWGYGHSPGRRKVAVCSRTPWRDVDSVGHPGLPAGRYVAATTDTASGPLRVVGLCIPWRDAHVRTGRRNRVAWEDHAAYLEPLPELLKQESLRGALVVAGDLNQTVPGTRSPRPVQDLLARAFADLEITTAGRSCGNRLLDHIAVTSHWNPLEVVLECLAHGEAPLSDHDAVVVTLEQQASL